MSDEDIPSSGSRWEPTDDAATEHLTTPVAPETVPAGTGAPPRPRRLRRRSAVAAAGQDQPDAGGVGGFAIGHAIDGTEASDPGTVTDSASDGFPDGADGARGGRPDFDRDGTVPGQVPAGPGTERPGADDGGTA